MVKKYKHCSILKIFTSLKRRLPTTRKISGRFPAEAAAICAVQVALRSFDPIKGVVNASQYDPPPLTPFSVAGCGQLQLGSSWPLGYFSSITVSCWSFSPQTVVVDSSLGDSWSYRTICIPLSLQLMVWLYRDVSKKYLNAKTGVYRQPFITLGPTFVTLF